MCDANKIMGRILDIIYEKDDLLSSRYLGGTIN